MAIGGIGATAVGAAGAAKRDRDENRTRAEPASKSRALVAIAALEPATKRISLTAAHGAVVKALEHGAIARRIAIDVADA